MKEKINPNYSRRNFIRNASLLISGSLLPGFLLRGSNSVSNKEKINTPEEIHNDQHGFRDYIHDGGASGRSFYNKHRPIDVGYLYLSDSTVIQGWLYS